MPESNFSLEVAATPTEYTVPAVGAFLKTNKSLDLMGVKVTANNPDDSTVWAVGGEWGNEYPGGWVTPGSYRIAVNPPGIHSGKTGKLTSTTRQYATVMYRVHSENYEHITNIYPGPDQYDPSHTYYYTSYPTYGDNPLPNQSATVDVTLNAGDSLQVAYCNPWYAGGTGSTYNSSWDNGNPYGITNSNGSPKGGAITSEGLHADTYNGFTTLAKVTGSDGMVVKCVASIPNYRAGLWAAQDTVSYNVAAWDRFKDIANDLSLGWGGTTFDGFTTIAQAIAGLSVTDLGHGTSSGSTHSSVLASFCIYRAHKKRNNQSISSPGSSWTSIDEEISQRVLEYAFNVPQTVHGMHGHEIFGQSRWTAYGYPRYAPYAYQHRMRMLQAAAVFGKTPDWEPLHNMLSAMAQAVHCAGPTLGGFQYANGYKLVCPNNGGFSQGYHALNGAPLFHQFLLDTGYALYFGNGEQELVVNSIPQGIGKNCYLPIQPGGNPGWGGPSNTIFSGGAHRLATWGYSVWARAVLDLPITALIDGMLWNSGGHPQLGVPHGCLISDDGATGGFSSFYPHLENQGCTALWGLFPKEGDPYNVRGSRMMKNAHKSWFFKYHRNYDETYFDGYDDDGEPIYRPYFGTSVTAAGTGIMDSVAYEGWIPAPENVQATDNGGGNVTITWDPVVAAADTRSDNAVSYSIYRSPLGHTVHNSTWRSGNGTGGATFPFASNYYKSPTGTGDGRNGQAFSMSKQMDYVTTISANSTSFQDSVAPGSYYYAISAHSNTGEGVQSEQRQVTVGTFVGTEISLEERAAENEELPGERINA